MTHLWKGDISPSGIISVHLCSIDDATRRWLLQGYSIKGTQGGDVVTSVLPRSSVIYKEQEGVCVEMAGLPVHLDCSMYNRCAPSPSPRFQSVCFGQDESA